MAKAAMMTSRSGAPGDDGTVGHESVGWSMCARAMNAQNITKTPLIAAPLGATIARCRKNCARSRYLWATP